MAWRTFWRTRIEVFYALQPTLVPAVPPGFDLVNLRDDLSGLAQAAMQMAAEPENLVESRFRNDDQFFGWMHDSKIVSFGWVTCGDRQIGRSLIPATPGWAFLYNFYTHPDFRGQGLYPQLLTAIIKKLTNDRPRVLIIDVNSRNKPSLRGIKKAGFIPVSSTSWVTVLRRWNCSHSPLRLDRVPPIVVGSTLSGGEHVGTSQQPGGRGARDPG
jgi:GNAT superfamily N-acetyltransferase